MSQLTPETLLPPAPSRKREGEQKPRIDLVDYAKGLGILLVVLGHTWRGLERNGFDLPAAVHRNGLIDRWVYGFHMPLFFFASGLFLYRSAAKPAAGFILDKLTTIAWPFAVWSVVYAVLGRGAKGGTGRPAWREFVDPNETHLWFLYTLFLIAMTMLALRKLRVPAWGTLLVSIALLIVVREDWLPLTRPEYTVAGQIVKFATFLPYVAAAATIAPGLMHVAQRWPAWPWALIAIAGAAVVTAAALFDPIAEPMSSLYSGWAGIAMTLAIARLLEVVRVPPLKWLGLLSLEIYLVHIAAAGVARSVLLKLHVNAWPAHLPLDFLAGVIGPLVLWWICQRVRFPYLFRLRRPRATTLSS